MSEAGRAWAEKVYREKLAAPATLPNLGPGYSNELRAARAVSSIADRKLYTRSGRGGHPTPNPLSRTDRAFWTAVAVRAGELASAAPPVPMKRSLRGFSMDDFDWDNTPDAKPAPANPAWEAYRALKRGSTFRIGNKSFLVFKATDEVLKYVTLVGTKGQKFYQALVQEYQPLVVEVRQVVEGDRVGALLVRGTPVAMR